jgi:hypothetical protein
MLCLFGYYCTVSNPSYLFVQNEGLTLTKTRAQD